MNDFSEKYYKAIYIPAPLSTCGVSQDLLMYTEKRQYRLLNFVGIFHPNFIHLFYTGQHFVYTYLYFLYICLFYLFVKGTTDLEDFSLQRLLHSHRYYYRPRDLNRHYATSKHTDRQTDGLTDKKGGFKQRTRAALFVKPFLPFYLTKMRLGYVLIWWLIKSNMLVYLYHTLFFIY